MINLISPNHRANLRTSKNNTILLGYVELIIAAMVVIAATIGVSYYFLKVEHDNVKKTADLEAASAKKLEAVNKKATNLKTDIAAIEGVLENDVHFSSILTQFGGLMAPGSALTGLSISKEDPSLPLVVSAQVVNETTAVVLLNNLRSSPLVSTVTLKMVQKLEATTEGPQKYSYSATYEVVLDPEADV